jgi:hypothetical protein
MDQSTAIALITLLTMVGGFLGQWLRDERSHQRNKEDRAAKTQEIVDLAKAEAEASHIRNEAIARELHLETLRTAANLREEQRIEAEALASKLEHVHVTAKEASKEAREAFKEANDVNAKIASYGKRLTERGAEAVEKLDTIEHIATEHTAQLEEIAENTRKDEA